MGRFFTTEKVMKKRGARPPLHVSETTIARWMMEAEKSARKIKQTMSERGQTDTLSVIPPKSWCGSCDGEKKHTHKVTL